MASSTSSSTPPASVAILSFISFLRCEAQLAEDRAKSLRATAAAIDANIDVAEGKKKRKRKAARTRRTFTAYTLFVHENYENIRKTQNLEGGPSKDIISMIAKQWAATTQEEKNGWKFRAEQLKSAGEAEDAEEEDDDDEMADQQKPAADPNFQVQQL